MNPYGVGVSGQDRITESRLCACCSIEFVSTGTREFLDLPGRCPDCAKHHSNNPGAELEMLREHCTRLPGAIKIARGMTRDAKAELMSVKEEAAKEKRERQEQVASALESRDRWREILGVVEEAHPRPDGAEGCGCSLPGCVVGALIRDARRRPTWGR